MRKGGKDREPPTRCGACWTNLPKHGDPSGADLPAWCAGSAPREASWANVACRPKLSAGSLALASRAKAGGPAWTRTRNQTVMSGRISTTFVDFLAVLFDFDGVRCTSIVSFLVRNWCGHSTSRRGRTSRCRWLRSAFSLVVVSHRRARSRSVCDLPWVWSPFPCCPSHASVRYPPTSLGLIELASRTP